MSTFKTFNLSVLFVITKYVHVQKDDMHMHNVLKIVRMCKRLTKLSSVGGHITQSSWCLTNNLT